MVGFPLLAVVTTALGIPNSIFSVFFRSIAVVFSIILIIEKAKPTNKFAVFLFLAFWILYFMRLAFTTAFESNSLSRPDSYYWIWSVGVCFIPALAVLLTYTSGTAERLLTPIIVVVNAALLLALLFGGTGIRTTDGEIIDVGRFSVESLNSITMGHLGVTGVLLGICVLLSEQLRKSMYILALAAVILGGLIAMFANSRGPLVAMLVCCMVIIIAGAHHRKTYIIAALFVLLGILLAAFNRDALFGNIGILWRFQAYFLGVDQSATIRMVSFEGAWTQFLSSPFIGDAIEERITNFYPHNLMLEALMATGIAGGLPFLGLLIMTLRCAWNLVSQGSKSMWMGVIAIQYIVAAMFSGSIYSSNTMWVLIALSLSASSIKRKASITLRNIPNVKCKS
ncbi:O-antigen ligase family protein [Loktanella salsilacus]|uniref:O-antigen ligase family protein n=1 Tax=Loktanella salsilacus TaxID=195913 RepID=UPI0030FB4C6D